MGCMRVATGVQSMFVDHASSDHLLAGLDSQKYISPGAHQYIYSIQSISSLSIVKEKMCTTLTSPHCRKIMWQKGDTEV